MLTETLYTAIKLTNLEDWVIRLSNKVHYLLTKANSNPVEIDEMPLYI